MYLKVSIIVWFWQGSNADLQNQLYTHQQKLKDQKRQHVTPEDLKRRLDDIYRALKAGRVSKTGGVSEV